MLDLNLNLNLPTTPATAAEPIEAAQPNPDQVYDTLILGGGPAGLNAALYAKRKGRSVLIITERIGGQLLDTSTVENYIGTIPPAQETPMTGSRLAADFGRNVRDLGIPILEGYRATAWDRNDALYRLHVTNGKSYQGRTVILATGAIPRHLNVPGEAALASRGVSYCAICDGPLFARKRHVIVGGGNAAVEAAIDMARIATEVTVLQRSTFRADAILMDELERLPNVTTHTQTDVLEILGDRNVTGVRVLDRSTQTERIVPAEAVFIEIGYNAQVEPFADDLDTAPDGSVRINADYSTNLPGIFAAGDVVERPFKQIVIAASDGAQAALAANQYLTTHTPQPHR